MSTPDKDLPEQIQVLLVQNQEGEVVGLKLYVAYVCLEEGYGTKILGVHVNQSKAKALCQHDYSMLREEGASAGKASLEWSVYEDHGTLGIQSTTPSDRQYYVEEAELELQSRHNDNNDMDWKDRKILQLYVDNGRLAQQVQEQAGMYKPLESRISTLSGYIDALLMSMGRQNHTFKDATGNDEYWEVGQS